MINFGITWKYQAFLVVNNINSFKLLTITGKSSILDIWHCSKYAIEFGLHLIAQSKLETAEKTEAHRNWK